MHFPMILCDSGSDDVIPSGQWSLAPIKFSRVRGRVRGTGRVTVQWG